MHFLHKTQIVALKNNMKQGEKLLLLVRRDHRNAEEIAEAMGIDKSYLPRLYKMDKLPPKPLKKALEVFHLPDQFFEEDGEMRTVEEPSPLYQSAQDEISRLQRELSAASEALELAKKELEEQKKINADLVEAILNLSKRQ